MRSDVTDTHSVQTQLKDMLLVQPLFLKFAQFVH